MPRRLNLGRRGDLCYSEETPTVFTVRLAAVSVNPTVLGHAFQPAWVSPSIWAWVWSLMADRSNADKFLSCVCLPGERFLEKENYSELCKPPEPNVHTKATFIFSQFAATLLVSVCNGKVNQKWASGWICKWTGTPGSEVHQQHLIDALCFPFCFS